ncbi:uncharacterized protein LOC124439128 isoform X2 [Xenia sp. Carnegie-2017]|uniref:uncharacterized protein LOC124439128 isoform X2 n=1 Tax=Xenia sp. Carnegie-2017 TaxID=2897299 RepID=UPI001F035FEA|nr:uncharacterized protein LOC124439128 isoform X2 [Xenia sp. Carnegie-2017]
MKKTLSFVSLTYLMAIQGYYQGKVDAEVPKITVYKSPPKSIQALTGTDVVFEWNFRISQVQKTLKAISWYKIIARNNWRNERKLIQRFLDKTTSKTCIHPRLSSEHKQRIRCMFSKSNQMWTTHCRLRSTMMSDGAEYGLSVEFNDSKILKGFNTSFLALVDLKLDTKKSDHEVKSLVNKTVVLTCAFERERVIATHYEWTAFGGTKDLTNKRSLSYGGKKTSYTFIPTSARDFGQYECTIRTDNTKIQHEIILKQLHYPGPPQGMRLQKTNGGRSFQLFWNPPKFDGGTRIIGYDVIVTPEKQIFTSQSTEHLSVGVKVRDHGNYTIQVCSLNEVGRNQTSCSSPHKITIGLGNLCYVKNN